MHHNSFETAERSLLEAIARRRVVTAIYNRTELSIAPHSLLTRHGALFLVNLGRTGRIGEEPRLGVFKLTGLTNVMVSADTFEDLRADPAAVMRPEDELVFSI